MKLAAALRLGRVSNLPTVWSNALAGVALAAGNLNLLRLGLLCLAMSALYVGGMFLNDAYDADVDRFERPERPIPSGQVAQRTVFSWGYTLIALGCMATAIVVPVFERTLRWEPVLSVVALAAFVVYYDADHKQNPAAPLLMGLCRAGIYVTCGFASTAEPDRLLYIGAFALLCYVVGLTYTAKQENLFALRNTWPLLLLCLPLLLPSTFIEAVPGVGWAWLFLLAFVVWLLHALYLLVRPRPELRQGVMSLIAGISLLDALFIAATGKPTLALAALCAFGVTWLAQRVVSGT